MSPQLPMEPLFWRYLIERESIRLRRLRGEPREKWTDDPVMKEYSFTNVKREHDRTTMLLKKEFYDKQELRHPSIVALLNATIFRYHGTIRAARAIGWHDDWNETHGAKMRQTVDLLQVTGRKPFTSAYIIPSCGSNEPKSAVVKEVVDQIWDSEHILQTDRWEEACEQMCRLWGVGQFMAKEVLLDYMLITRWKPEDWETWTPVGPGARRGAAVVRHGRVRPGCSPGEALEVCKHLYRNREHNWPSNFVRLDLTDIQFALCELAKYRKVQIGEGRPKRKFRPTIDGITSQDAVQIAREEGWI